MPLPASLIASIVSAVLEAASQTSTTTSQNTNLYDSYVVARKLPPQAKQGVMQPPAGNGRIIIDGTELALSPAAQFRNTQNLIVMPMTIQENKDILYINDTSGSVFRIWIVSQAEISAIQKN